jgi:soluble cytochrome b562
VLWALTDLLLLARAYPGGNLFTVAVTSNWRPEYLVLLGLPVAAAATAKAVVSGSNAGKGPVKSSDQAEKPDQNTRVYLRDPVSAEVKGFGAGMAELITADDRTVAWADLQYVVFTLITLVYFLVQVLAQPQHGLPPVPAALLTLMGVSASGYTASKIVEAKGAVPTQD